MQKTDKEKVLDLIAKGVSLTCIKRTHNLSINQIIQISNQKQNEDTPQVRPRRSGEVLGGQNRKNWKGGANKG